MTRYRYRLAKHARVRRVGEKMLLVDVEAARVYVLNEEAAFILEHLEGESAEVGEIAENIASEYGVSRERAAEDALVFLKEMVGAGVVEELISEDLVEENPG